MTPNPDDLGVWLDTQLSAVLGFPSTQEITNYILSFDNGRDQEQYLSEMLDPSNPDHVRLVRDFMDKKREHSSGQTVAGGLKVYKKAQEAEEYVATKSKSSSPAPSSSQPSHKAAKSQKDKKQQLQQQQQYEQQQLRKGKTKYVSMYSNDGKAKDVVMKNGRHLCECQTTKHKLVNNCLACGRVVCVQEGSGPCLFCGNLVCTREEQEILDRKSKKSEILLKKLLDVENVETVTEMLKKQSFGLDATAKEAQARKDTLLEYDKTAEKRTQVIDDESDYFSVDSNKWLTLDQRKKLKKREEEIREERHGSRLNRKITFDFAGRKVIEEPMGNTQYDPSQDKVVKEILEGAQPAAPYIETERKTLTDGDGVINPSIKVPRPMLVEVDNGRAGKKSYSKSVTQGSTNRRLQDKELQEMSDEGFCMTMHQPYASLLVQGIKRDEGRTWYSSHRGRLWIHAASKVPTDQEVKEVHDFYKLYYGHDNLPFPQSYPTSCLLGSVDVREVLSQEEYSDKFPNGESSSPFVFVCDNPQELLVKVPMSGQHKIYKLDTSIHAAAKKSVKKTNDH